MKTSFALSAFITIAAVNLIQPAFATPNEKYSVASVIADQQKLEAKGRKGSQRVGGQNSKGKGSKYVGGRK